MVTFTEETETDHDSFFDQYGVHHEQPTGTDWAPSDQIEAGLTSSDEGGSALEAFLPLEEDSGTTANDVTGNGHDGTHVDTVTTGVTGPLGNSAYSFASNGAVNCGNFGAAGTFDNADWTATAFVNWDTFSGDDSNQTVVSYKHSFGPFWQIQHNTFGNFFFTINDDSSETRLEIADSFASTGTWYLMAFVHSESGGPTAYIVEPDRTVQSDTGADVGSLEGSNNDLRIGSTNSTSERLEGDVWSLRIYSRALSQDDVLGLHDTVFGTSEYWADVKTS